MFAGVPDKESGDVSFGLALPLANRVFDFQEPWFSHL